MFRAMRFALVLLSLPIAVHAAVLEPSQPGPLAVGVSTITVIDAGRGRRLVTEVWYPAETAGRDTPGHRGRVPLVLVAHGFCGSRLNYEYLTVHLASWGFLVAAPDFPGLNQTDCNNGGVSGGTAFVDQPKDLTFLREVFHQRTGPAAAFVGHVRGTRTGLVGHSYGGFDVLRAGMDDRRFTVVAGLAAFWGGLQPSDFAKLGHRPVMSLGGTADTLLPFDQWAAPLFAMLRPPAFLVRITGGTHDGFSDDAGSLPPDRHLRQQTVALHYVTALLERFLVGDRRYARFLTAKDAAQEGPDVALTAHLR